jgi:hypothetical protein
MVILAEGAVCSLNLEARTHSILITGCELTNAARSFRKNELHPAESVAAGLCEKAEDSPWISDPFAKGGATSLRRRWMKNQRGRAALPTRWRQPVPPLEGSRTQPHSPDTFGTGTITRWRQA